MLKAADTSSRTTPPITTYVRDRMAGLCSHDTRSEPTGFSSRHAAARAAGAASRDGGDLCRTLDREQLLDRPIVRSQTVRTPDQLVKGRTTRSSPGPPI